MMPEEKENGITQNADDVERSSASSLSHFCAARISLKFNVLVEMASILEKESAAVLTGPSM